MLSRLHLLAAAFVLVASFGNVASAQLTNRDGPRVRIGLEAGLGPEPGNAGVAHGALLGQLGVQLGDRFAVYYQPSLFLRAVGRDPSDAIVRNSDHLLVGDFTFGAFQLGLGAGIAATPRATCQASTACVTSASTVQPAVGARVAAVITVPGVRARWGVPIAAHLHLADPLADARTTSLVFTLGLQRF